MDSTSAAGHVAVASSSNAASEGDHILQVPLERVSSVSEPPSQMVDSASQQSRQQISSLLSVNANPKDNIFCEDEEEKVCRVCCCVEPDQDGENALALLGITSHLPLLEEQLRRSEEQSAKLLRSLSRGSARSLRVQDGQVPSHTDSRKGSFRGLAADIARRIFQKEEMVAPPASEQLKRSTSLSNTSAQPAIVRSRSLSRIAGHQAFDSQQPSEYGEKEEGHAQRSSSEHQGSTAESGVGGASGAQHPEVASPATTGDHVVDIGPVITSQHSKLLHLNCNCQGDLSLCHYACFLRWVVSRGTSGAECDNKCEICGQPAKSISEADISTVNLALRHRRRVMAAHPELGDGHLDSGSGLSEQQLGRSNPGPNNAPQSADATLAESTSSLSACDEASDDGNGPARIAAAAWFDPLNRTGADRRGIGRGLQVERGLPGLAEGAYPMTRGTKVVVEVLGIMLATALLTLTLSRLFMDVLAQNEISFGLHYILAAIISFVIVLWFRVVAVPRLRSGPARSGAVVMCIWLMVLGVWFSGTKPADRPSGQ